MGEVFLDTNVLAYQFDGSEPAKQERARGLLAGGGHDFQISTQVLLELYQVLTRKLRPPLPAPAARRVIERLSALPVVPADADLVNAAVRTSQEHQVSIWDAMIIEAARAAGCPTVWSEDLAHGSTLRGVRIENPFF